MKNNLKEISFLLDLTKKHFDSDAANSRSWNFGR